MSAQRLKKLKKYKKRINKVFELGQQIQDSGMDLKTFNFNYPEKMKFIYFHNTAKPHTYFDSENNTIKEMGCVCKDNYGKSKGFFAIDRSMYIGTDYTRDYEGIDYWILAFKSFEKEINRLAKRLNLKHSWYDKFLNFFKF